MNAGRSTSRTGPLGPNDKVSMVGHQTVSAQPHPASSLRFLNDPLERQKVLVLGEKHSPAHASVEHVENHPPPPENVASVGKFTAFYQDIPALSIWWLSPFHRPAGKTTFKHLAGKPDLLPCRGNGFPAIGRCLTHGRVRYNASRRRAARSPRQRSATVIR